MNLFFNENLSKEYKSSSQKIRVMSEIWFKDNMFCPCCGDLKIRKFENNMPVSDFYCDNCKEIFELKSKGGSIGRKIIDGAYKTAIERITSNTNPHLFVLQYDNLDIINLTLVPKFFFTPSIIEKRKPLSDTAKRAGWTGCNILYSDIPKQGKIDIICNRTEIKPCNVITQYNKCKELQTNNIEKRGWLFDIMQCVNKMQKTTFTLQDVYAFEHFLADKHIDNHNVRPKIRQQLQILRDKGYIEFLGDGIYRKK